MSRRTEDWPLSRNGARRVEGWDDGAEPPERTGWWFFFGILCGTGAWVVIGIAVRAWWCS